MRWSPSFYFTSWLCNERPVDWRAFEPLARQLNLVGPGRASRTLREKERKKPIKNGWFNGGERVVCTHACLFEKRGGIFWADIQKRREIKESISQDIVKQIYYSFWCWCYFGWVEVRLGCIWLLPDHEFLDGRRSKQRWVIHGVQLPMLIVGKSLAASGSSVPAHGIWETCPEQVVVLDR